MIALHLRKAATMLRIAHAFARTTREAKISVDDFGQVPIYVRICSFEKDIVRDGGLALGLG